MGRLAGDAMSTERHVLRTPLPLAAAVAAALAVGACLGADAGRPAPEAAAAAPEIETAVFALG